MQSPSHRVSTRYWIVAELGEGGMGRVTKAWDADLKRFVALKFLKASDERSRRYFRREAELAAALDHPNVAKVYEVGEREGVPFIALQFIEGRPLSEMFGCDDWKGLPEQRRLDVVRQVLTAVRFAHERVPSIIHRDLKPSNIMVDPHGHVYVTDFGLAKATASEDGVTLTGSTMIGTPQYVAPEQAAGKADRQSDLYSLGAVLYELATGRPPFTGESAQEVLAQVVDLRIEPAYPRKVDRSISPELEAIIVRSLKKRREERYRTAAEVQEDLDLYCSGMPLKHAKRVTPLAVLRSRIRRQPLAWALGLALSLSVMAGAVASFILNSQIDRTSPDPAPAPDARFTMHTVRLPDFERNAAEARFPGRISISKSRDEFMKPDAHGWSSMNFERLAGDPAYPFARGRKLHNSDTSFGIKVAPLRFVGQTNNFGYETWLTTPSDGSGVYSMNGSDCLMGGRHRLQVYLPAGIKRLGMDLGASKTPEGAENSFSVYVKLGGMGTEIPVETLSLKETPLFRGYSASEDIEIIDFVNTRQTGLPPYLILDNLVFPANHSGMSPDPMVLETMLNVECMPGERNEVGRRTRLELPKGTGYLGHSLTVMSSHPADGADLAWSQECDYVRSETDGDIRSVELRVTLQPKKPVEIRVSVSAKLRVVVQEGITWKLRP